MWVMTWCFCENILLFLLIFLWYVSFNIAFLIKMKIGTLWHGGFWNSVSIKTTWLLNDFQWYDDFLRGEALRGSIKMAVPKGYIFGFLVSCIFLVIFISVSVLRPVSTSSHSIHQNPEFVLTSIFCLSCHRLITLRDSFVKAYMLSLIIAWVSSRVE